jgi:hypothetical protein
MSSWLVERRFIQRRVSSLLLKGAGLQPGGIPGLKPQLQEHRLDAVLKGSLYPSITFNANSRL